MAKNFNFLQSDGPCLALKERTEIVLKLLWKLVDANFFHPLTTAVLIFFRSTVHFFYNSKRETITAPDRHNQSRHHNEKSVCQHSDMTSHLLNPMNYVLK